MQREMFGGVVEAHAGFMEFDGQTVRSVTIQIIDDRPLTIRGFKVDGFCTLCPTGTGYQHFMNLFRATTDQRLSSAGVTHGKIRDAFVALADELLADQHFLALERHRLLQRQIQQADRKINKLRRELDQAITELAILEEEARQVAATFPKQKGAV